MLKKSILKRNILIFFSFGLINALPFIFEEFSFISWFSFVPFIVFIINLIDSDFSNKKVFACIFAFSIAYYFTIYHFFVALYPLSFVGMGKFASVAVIAFAWILLSTFHAIELTLGIVFALKVSCGRITKILSIALAFVLVEYAQYVGPLSFPWIRVSLPQYNILPLIQSATLFGPYFVDLLLMLSNAFLSIIILSNKKIKLLICYALLFFTNLLFGLIYMSNDTNVSSKANVSLVQGNVLTSDKWYGSSSYSTYLNITRSLSSNSDIVIWGETAIPLELNESKKVAQELVSYCDSNDTEMIVGAFYRNYYNKELNGAYYVTKKGISDKVYFKRKLVPFGEYLPLRKLLDFIPFLSDMNLYTSDLYPGKFTEVFSTQNGKIGCIICFDSIFHTLSRESVNDGAELLVILTNDSWYKDFPAVYQHNAQAVWRAIENNRWVVRCANSGISSVISNNGETMSSLPPLTKGTITESVSFIQDKSLYSKIGDIIIILPLLYFALIFIYKKMLLRSKSIS